MASDSARNTASESTNRSSGPARKDSTDETPSRAEQRRVVMGKFEVVQHIATGGMGAVYRARDTETGRDVALKVLPPDLASRPNMLERFKREARSAKKLHHENIVTLYEYGEIQSTHYLAMEFVEGTDLYEHVKRNGPCSPEEARQFILQGARALRAAHEQNIVHRDIKPSNFLLTRKNNRLIVKLTDFGLARDVDGDDFRVTKAGTTVGTVDYMSPEQARDSWSADIRSDLYSLGSTWYHLLTGHPPFPEGGLGERLIKIMQQEPPDIREINPLVSDETWAILHHLLAKEPDDRYQTPTELIEDLQALEGQANVRDGKSSKTSKTSPASTRKTSTDEEIPAPDQRGRQSWYIMAGLGCVLLICGIAVIASMPDKPPTPPEEVHNPIDQSPPILTKMDLPGIPQPGSAIPEPVKVEPAKKEPVETKGVNPALIPLPHKPPDRPVLPEVKHLRALAAASRKVDVQALHKEVFGPWENLPGGEHKVFTQPGSALVVQVGRGLAGSPTTFRSLASACKSAPAGKALIIEIHDNGPLFEQAIEAVTSRDILIRAGKGYRPLLIWDVQATVGQQTPRKPEDPLVFLPIHQGRLFLEGIELAWLWPEGLANPGVLLHLGESDLFVSDCTFSAAGKAPAGMTLVRCQSQKQTRCRIQRSQARGGFLTALDLQGRDTEVLFDKCLFVSGQHSLLHVRSEEDHPARIHIVRSTLIAGPALLEVQPVVKEQSPALSVLSWDSFLAHPEGRGDLLVLPDGASTQYVRWSGYNTLYAGWKRLFAGPKAIAGADLESWRQLWQGGCESDGVSREPWPVRLDSEPASQSASVYQPPETLRFAATVAPEQPLGCPDLALPGCRNDWIARALEPVFSVPDAPVDVFAPEIPNPGDGRFHGARLDLRETDLGRYLGQVQKTSKLGPKVVLHLAGKGEHRTEPIRLQDTHLVLYFEPAAEKETPTSLLLSATARVVPFIEVSNGSVEVINGFLRVPDLNTIQVSHLIKVAGGDIRLNRCRLEGPQQQRPRDWVGALSLQGSGQLGVDRVHHCAINESVILSNQLGVLLHGIGSRLVLRQSLLVVGRDAIEVSPGAACKGQASIQCSLTNVTIAAGRSVLHLGDAPLAQMVSDPVLVHARDCVYVNPFYQGKSEKAGLLLYEGDALSRGLLLWQGQRESFDPRLYFAAASGRGNLPDSREGYSPWKALWGSSGCRDSRELSYQPVFQSPPARWVLERLKFTSGANLDRLLKAR